MCMVLRSCLIMGMGAGQRGDAAHMGKADRVKPLGRLAR